MNTLFGIKGMIEEDGYSSAVFILRREYGFTPLGNPVSGRWVLRDKALNWIDFDTYRNDLASRNNLELREI